MKSRRFQRRKCIRSLTGRERIAVYWIAADQSAEHPRERRAARKPQDRFGGATFWKTTPSLLGANPLLICPGLPAIYGNLSASKEAFGLSSFVASPKTGGNFSRIASGD